MKISTCIITRNEEDNLPRCLQSVATLSDEIIIIDSGSTDRTKFIATEFNARFITHEWEGYVGQKNFACSKAKHDWILSIDADEEVSPDLSQSILEVKNSQQATELTGYDMVRVVRFMDTWIRFGDWYPDLLVRLFKKEAAHFEGGRVHERLVIEGTTSRLEGELYHYTYRDWEDQKQRVSHYASLWAQDAREKGKASTPLSPLTHSLWRLIRSYLIKGGWKGGALGWKLAVAQAHETYLKYKELRKFSLDVSESQ
ncbi:MAG: glycosyltransferase family 2 protein [Verrucomicrobiota bacterium]